MKLEIRPAVLSGTVKTPGSKSHTIRAVIIASLAKGTSIIKAPLVSEDTLSCIRAASALGAYIKRGNDDEWTISGTNGKLLEPARTLDLGNSGTSTRLLAAIASLAGHEIRFDGDESLRTRHMAPLLDALVPLGVEVTATEGKCPCSVHGPLNGGVTKVNGKSSQYLSALLMATPLAKHDTTIFVDDLHEVPYVRLTLDWLKRQEIELKYNDDMTRFDVRGGQKYKAFESMIPGDFSTACFPAVAGAVTGDKIKQLNLDFSDEQGDKQIFEYLSRMGASVSTKKDVVTVKKGKLKAVELDLNSTPDALPILCVAAACAKGKSVFRNVPQARIKETDRIACMTTELRKMGIEVEEFEDGMAVTGGELKSCLTLESYKDHRIAMSLAVAAMAATDGGISLINDAECIDVTYPGFIRDFTNLGATFKIY